jgi:hypothetical protein
MFSRIFLSVFFLLSAFCANAADPDIYTVSGVAVNVLGKSPATAKSSAHANARRDAFATLLARLEMRSDVINSVNDEEISDMVRSEQIESEKISGNNYSATFNIVFAKDFVEHILTQKKSGGVNKEKIEEASLLIPVVMKKHQPLLWGENNDWKKSLIKAIKTNSVSGFAIPDSDISNVATIDEKNIENLDYALLEPVLSKYKSNIAYVLIFSYDEIENKVLVRVVRISRLQKNPLKLSFVNVNRLGYEELMDKVATKTITYLTKSVESPQKLTDAGLIKIKIDLNDLSDWIAIRNKIEKSNLINQLNIDSISRDFVMISIRYVGYADVAEAFAGKGIALTKISQNYYSINAK